MSKAGRELIICAVIGAVVIAAPVGVAVYRSQEDDHERQHEYACILNGGENCEVNP